MAIFFLGEFENNYVVYEVMPYFTPVSLRCCYIYSMSSFGKGMSSNYWTSFNSLTLETVFSNSLATTINRKFGSLPS